MKTIGERAAEKIAKILVGYEWIFDSTRSWLEPDIASIIDKEVAGEEKDSAKAGNPTPMGVASEETGLAPFEILDGGEVRLKIGNQWVYRGNQNRRWFYLADRGETYAPSGIAESVDPESWFLLEEIARLRALGSGNPRVVAQSTADGSKEEKI